MLITVSGPKRVCIKVKKFADHPVAVGHDPHTNGQVMAKFTHNMACTPGYNERNNKGGKNHQNAQRFPDHTPGEVFKKPENNVQVFNKTPLAGNAVAGGV